MHEADDPAPRLRLLLAPETGAARCDSRFRRDAQHLAHHEPGAAERTRPQVDQVEVADVAVARRVHVHRRDDDPVLELELAQPERHEHRRPPAGAACGAPLPGELVCEPLVDGPDELLVAEAEVVVGDAAASRQQVEDELLVGLVEVLR